MVNTKGVNQISMNKKMSTSHRGTYFAYGNYYLLNNTMIAIEKYIMK